MKYIVKTKREVVMYDSFDEAYEHAKAEGGSVWKATEIVNFEKQIWIVERAKEE